ncbi:MAG: TetR/AcrR family transcriptional regulator [Candidatus Kapabacteria bacterium]|nr:TetR/AcrR family transcriptional regulator [Candidatus Kapabacteria bacterium]
MGNKEIQEERMRGYFIQSTKDILKGEGIKNISVRNISERAGYSFATLYNYFKDVKELIFLCVQDFQDECLEHVIMRSSNIESGLPKIKAICNSYIEYFVQYPGIFELFFIERLSDIGNNQESSELIISFLNRLCENEWVSLVEKEVLTFEQTKVKKSILNYSTIGLMLIYMNRRHPESYKEFLEEVNLTLDTILK